MKYLGQMFDKRYSALIILFGFVFIFPLLVISNPRPKRQSLVIPINSATMPPCVEDIKNLPIFLITASMTDGAGYRGTAFLIDDMTWVTAAHVIDGDIKEIAIHTPNGKYIGTVDSIDTTADIAIITTEESIDYAPISVRQSNHEILDDIWNVGYPGWAGVNRVVSSGKVFSESNVGMVYTSATVMQGMSGGPTLSCNGGTLEASSVISMFAQELLSEKEAVVDGIPTVEKVFLNTGDSFSARLNQVDHIKELHKNKTYVTIKP